MTLNGASLIGGRSVFGQADQIAAVDPVTGTELGPRYSQLAVNQLRWATAVAGHALPVYAALAPKRRAQFLETIATGIDGIRDEIVERAVAETGLSPARLIGEVARTTGQLRMFAQVVRSGDYLGVRVDPALPDRQPLPRPDIRQVKVPLGPVAVFAASNFPFAFSVAGGDTASALAAGCPVIVKAHNAHPGTSELVGQVIVESVAECGLPAGVFALIYGPGTTIGQALVSDPAIAAVGFTGSRSGGLALVRTAQQRDVPIPVYAEMSSVNPVIVLPGALRTAKSRQAVTSGYLASITGSSGQLCTSPGLMFVPAGEDGDALVAEVAHQVAAVVGQTMLTPHIFASWQRGVEKLAASENVALVGNGVAGTGQNAPPPTVFTTSLETATIDPQVSEEIFGAASTIVRWDAADDASLAFALGELDGQLTATLHLEESDDADVAMARTLIPVLVRRAGRVIVGGWPTGVDVGHAIVHGGPYPATSDSRSTSVGSLAIERWLRPVSFQGFPDVLLPDALREDNPWQVSRMIDGMFIPAPAR